MASSLTLKTFPVSLLTDHDRGLRFSALLSTGQAQTVSDEVKANPAHLETLLKLIANPDTPLSVSIGAGVVLEDLAGSDLLKTSIPTLGRMSKAPDARLRMDACYYLGLTADQAAEPYLQACLQDEDAQVREVAKEGLEHCFSQSKPTQKA